MTLYPVTSQIKSSPLDVSQLTTLLNGTDTASILVVSNRIQAARPGAKAGSGYVGGTFTPGDLDLNTPAVQDDAFAAAIAPDPGTFLTGDFACDEAGLFWTATGNTSGGLTPWISVGKGGLSTCTRQWAKTNGHPMRSDVLYGNVDYGTLQYSNWSAPETFGFRIPTTGYYEVSSSMHYSTGNFTTTAGMSFGWSSVPDGSSFFGNNPSAGDFGDLPDLRTHGDFIQGTTESTHSMSSPCEDLLFFTQGDHVAPFLYVLEPSNVSSSQGPVDDGTKRATMYCTIRLFSAGVST